MNNFDIFENTFSIFKLAEKSKTKSTNNCFSNCQAKISPRLPFWINQQPFWTYQCACCQTYKFEAGKVFKGGFDD